jgi:hypothetical protein
MGLWPCCSFRSQSYIIIHDHTAVENNILQKISRVFNCSGYWHFGWRFNVPFIASGKFEMAAWYQRIQKSMESHGFSYE